MAAARESPREQRVSGAFMASAVALWRARDVAVAVVVADAERRPPPPG